MATYVNNLRLTELATGEGSGTWGNTTNLNLEAIADSLGYNTVAITGDTTFTIPDGRTASPTNNDKARSMYFAMTSSGSLSGTKVITFAPNTISRVMLIENATTGTAITQIKQGSGGTVNIPNGKTKLVYMDGAGTGAKVIDISPTLDLTGVDINGASSITGTSLDINGNADISGDLTLSAGADGALRFSAASSIKILDNSATSLVIEEADNAYITFDTTNSSEKVAFAKLAEFANLKFTASSITVTDIKDEDNMSSASDTALATQQSIKAYVDSQIVLFDTLAEVLAAGNTTGGTKISVDNTSGGIDLIDNAKIRLGTGNDLEIYHDGNNSIIDDSGTGVLFIRATRINLQNLDADPNELMASFIGDGAAQLYHDNSIKLTTNSTGIEVTGTTTSDSMRVGQQVSPYDTAAKQSAFLLGDDNTDDADKKNAAAFKITNNTGAGATVIEDMVDNNSQNIVYAGRHQYFMTKESTGAPESALGSDLSDSATSLTTSSNISSTVTATATRPSPAILSDGSGGANESVMVYGISGTTLTIARGMDGTTPRAFTTANSAKIEFVHYTPRLIFGNDFYDTRFIQASTASTSPYTTHGEASWNDISVFDIDTSGPLIPARGGSGGRLRFRELASNGTNTVTLLGPTSTSNITINLPSSAGTLALTSDISGATAVGALNSGSITSGFGNIDNGSSTITTTGAITGGSLDINGAADISGDLTLSAGGDGALTFANAGENSIKIPDNQASALIVEEANTAYMTFVTTNGGEKVTFGKDIDVTGTVTADGLTMLDGEKITLGTGGDLEIYHNGSNSVIEEKGTGNLFIKGTDLVLEDTSGNKFFKGVSGGAVQIWHNAASHATAKLQTTATGIDVTGTVTADSFILEDGSGNKTTLAENASGNITLTLPSSAGTLALTSDIAGTTVTNATNAAHVLVTDNESTSENNLIAFVEDAASSTGNHGLEMDGNLTYNPSSGTVTATAFAGALTGNVTGNASGSSGSCTGNAATATLATTVTVSDNTANTNFPVVFNDESNALLDDTGALTYNPSTGTLKSPSVTSSPSLANGTSLITGNISSADFKSYAGQRIVYYGSGAGEFDLFDAATADIGKTFVIVNASDDTITLDVDGGGTAQYVGVLTGSSNDGQNTNITIVTGGVAELVCVRGTGNGGSAAAPNFIIFGSGI